MDIPQVIKQQRVSHNRFFDQMTDSLALAQGGSYDYHYLDCAFDAVVVVPILPDGKLLIERIYRHPYAAYIHEFPAGGIEQGEDPCLAGGRELQEETGYQAGRLIPLQQFEALPGLLHMRLHFVLATDLSFNGDLERDALELMEIEAVSLDQAWSYTHADCVSSFLTVGLLAYERHLRMNHG